MESVGLRRVAAEAARERTLVVRRGRLGNERSPAGGEGAEVGSVGASALERSGKRSPRASTEIARDSEIELGR